MSFKVRGVIFDLDGTLADTFKLIVIAWNAAVSPHTGKTYSDADVISRFGIPDPQMIRRELPGAPGDQADEVYHAAYEREHGVVKPFPGITDMLNTLRERSVPMGVMTGKGRRSANITLRALGWTEMFGAVVTGDEVRNQKPDPAGVLSAARILGLDPKQCAFVGDSPVDIGAGRNAGMVTAFAGWHPVYADEVRKLEPDVWARQPVDIVSLI